MPARRTRPAMYNTPTLRNGGFGALQVEAVTNRPLSIARRHLAASQLRMRDIEPDQLTSSEWVRFLVMEEGERERWMSGFNRRRRGSDESSSSSSSSSSADAEQQGAGYDKAEEARQEAEEAAATAADDNDNANSAPQVDERRSPPPDTVATRPTRAGRTPSVSIWARQFDQQNDSQMPTTTATTATPVYSARRPRHVRRAVTDGIVDPPPTYESALRSRTDLPPSYEHAVPSLPTTARR